IGAGVYGNAVAARVPGGRKRGGVDGNRDAAQSLGDVVFAVAVRVVEDNAAERAAHIRRARRVNGVVVGERASAVLQNADANLVLHPERGVDGQQLTAMTEVEDAAVANESAEGIGGSRVGRAAGDALAPAIPEEAGLGHARAGPDAFR